MIRVIKLSGSVYDGVEVMYEENIPPPSRFIVSNQEYYMDNRSDCHLIGYTIYNYKFTTEHKDISVREAITPMFSSVIRMILNANKSTFCYGRFINEGNTEHDLGPNYFGDLICKYCCYAPNGHKPIEEITVRLTKDCQNCDHPIESHDLNKCNDCDCINPVFAKEEKP